MRRSFSDWEKSPFWKEVQLLIGHLQPKEILHDQQQERDVQVKKKVAFIQRSDEDTTHLMAEAFIDQLQKELQEGRRLISNFTKQKGKEVRPDTVREKDEEIESLKNKLEDEKEEKENLRQELQDKVNSLQQQLKQFVIPQSGMCVLLVVHVDMMHVSVLFQN